MFTVSDCVCSLSTVVEKLLERELVMVAVVVTLAVTESTAGSPNVALSETPTAKELSCVTVQVAVLESPCCADKLIVPVVPVIVPAMLPVLEVQLGVPCTVIGIGPSCKQIVAGALGYSGGLTTIFTPPSPYVFVAYC